jgi:hypothetical protein
LTIVGVAGDTIVGGVRGEAARRAAGGIDRIDLEMSLEVGVEDNLLPIRGPVGAEPFDLICEFGAFGGVVGLSRLAAWNRTRILCSR